QCPRDIPPESRLAKEPTAPSPPIPFEGERTERWAVAETSKATICAFPPYASGLGAAVTTPPDRPSFPERLAQPKHRRPVPPSRQRQPQQAQVSDGASARPHSPQAHRAECRRDHALRRGLSPSRHQRAETRPASEALRPGQARFLPQS